MHRKLLLSLVLLGGVVTVVAAWMAFKGGPGLLRPQDSRELVDSAGFTGAFSVIGNSFA